MQESPTSASASANAADPDEISTLIAELMTLAGQPLTTVEAEYLWDMARVGPTGDWIHREYHLLDGWKTSAAEARALAGLLFLDEYVLWAVATPRRDADVFAAMSILVASLGTRTDGPGEYRLADAAETRVRISRADRTIQVRGRGTFRVERLGRLRGRHADLLIMDQGAAAGVRLADLGLLTFRSRNPQVIV